MLRLSSRHCFDRRSYEDFYTYIGTYLDEGFIFSLAFVEELIGTADTPLLYVSDLIIEILVICTYMDADNVICMS